jgi:4'-phosphopantetheinyl transferase
VLEFSLARRGGRAVVAVTRERRVGVDVELVDPSLDVLALAHTAMSAPERRAIADTPASRRPAAFARCWARKEAYLKALGRGLADGADWFAVAASADGTLALDVFADRDEGARWTILDLAAGPEHAAALAVDGAVRPRVHVRAPR